MNDLIDIYEHVGEKDTLLGLAEECSELSAAALKLVRAIEGKTPKSNDICITEFLEEFADVEATMMAIMNADWFVPEEVFDIYDAKVERWRKRLKQFDKTGSMVETDTASTNPSIEHEKKIADAFTAIGKMARDMAEVEKENALKLIDSLMLVNDTFRRELIMSDAIMSIGKEEQNDQS